MPITSEGLPYPAASEPFAEANEHIQQLAEAVPDLARSWVRADTGTRTVPDSGSFYAVTWGSLDMTDDWTVDGDSRVFTYTGPPAVFLVSTSVAFDVNGTGHRDVRIRTGAGSERYGVSAPTNAGYRTRLAVAGTVEMGTGFDGWVAVVVRQNSGGSLDIDEGDGMPNQLRIQRVCVL